MVAPVAPKSQMDPSVMLLAAGMTWSVTYWMSGVEVARRNSFWRKVRKSGLSRKLSSWLRKVRMASGRRDQKVKVGGSRGRGCRVGTTARVVGVPMARGGWSVRVSERGGWGSGGAVVTVAWGGAGQEGCG